ncbi:MAG: hypothetical protein V6Z86_03150 [Hyphomicrobiales bacterium]
MDKSANPTPKTDTVPTPAPEPGGEADGKPKKARRGTPEESRCEPAHKAAEHTESQDGAFKQRVRDAIIELQTEGDLVMNVGDDHKTRITGSVTHRIGSTLLTRVGGSMTSVVGGASTSSVGGTSISGSFARINVSPLRAYFSGTRLIASGYDIKTNFMKRGYYYNNIENKVSFNGIHLINHRISEAI